MSGPTKYTFWIKNETPETMSLARLVEYYQQLGALFGDPSALHLVQIHKGSHGSELRVETNDAGMRILGLRDGSAPAETLKARDRIDEMLADDATSGHFSDQENNVIYLFSAKREPKLEAVSFRDSGSITGELYYMNGGTKGVNIRIRLSEGGNVAGRVSHDIAKQMRPHLLEQVRVFGEATWTRDEKGWIPSDFEIHRFVPLVRGNLRSAVDTLRAFDISWRDDPLNLIAELNEEKGDAG